MSDSIRIPDSIDTQRLQAMQLVAKMKESADKHGVGFIGDLSPPMDKNSSCQTWMMKIPKPCYRTISND
jgi:hypothetical protein